MVPVVLFKFEMNALTRLIEQQGLQVRTTILLIAVSVVSAGAMAQVYVKPHTTKNGTFVEGYERTAPNNTNLDNYSTKGNTNPYTGQQGTVQPNYSPPTYQSPQQSYQQPNQQRCGYSGSGQYICR